MNTHYYAEAYELDVHQPTKHLPRALEVRLTEGKPRNPVYCDLDDAAFRAAARLEMKIRNAHMVTHRVIEAKKRRFTNHDERLVNANIPKGKELPRTPVM